MVIKFSSYSCYVLSLLIHLLFFLSLLIPKYHNNVKLNEKSVTFNFSFSNIKKDVGQKKASMQNQKLEKEDTKKIKQNIQKQSSVKKDGKKKLAVKNNVLKNNKIKLENDSIQDDSNLSDDKRKNQNNQKTLKSNTLRPLRDYDSKPSTDTIDPKINNIAKSYQSVSNERTNNQSVKNKEKQLAFNDYNSYLKKSIQIEASKNYPKRSIRNNEEGIVELVFSLDEDGFLNEISLGKKTFAPKRLIEASKKTLEKLSPFKKNAILNNVNIFSIAIIYKLN